MKLKLLRFLEGLFSAPAAFFGDLADNVDYKLHKRLHEAMRDIKARTLEEGEK